MVTEAGKELLRNTINTAKFHNRILEENEMWKQWELECGLTMMVSDDDIIKRIKKNHQCSKHRKRDKSRSRDSSRSKYEMAKIRQGAGSSNDRWDHSGFAELYPDADVSDKYPSTSVSTVDRHKKKKKKKSRHRSDSSDEEIWEEFKRYKKSKKDEGKLKSVNSKSYDGHVKEWNKPAYFWNKERTLRLIDLLREAPALWNINYPGYRDQRVKLKETKRIASIFHVDEDEIVTKIAFLVNEFHEEHKKLTLKKLNGASDYFSENVWFAYEHLTFLKNNKNERFCKTLKNNLKKEGNTHWIDSSDSYSESEDETPRPSANQSIHCIKSKVQEKMNVNEKKTNYTSPNLSSYSEDEASRPSAKQLSRYIKSKGQEEIMIVNEKKTKCTSLNSSSYSENETSQPSPKQSSRYIKNKAQDEKLNIGGKKDNYTCINLASCSNSENEASWPSANQSNCCVKSKIPDEKRDEHGKKDTSTNLPYVQAYMAKKDSFSVYGEIVAHRMRQAKKSSKAVERAECEINMILRSFEAGFFDSPEDTFK